jgi:hypothetical protein
MLFHFTGELSDWEEFLCTSERKVRFGTLAERILHVVVQPVKPKLKCGSLRLHWS